MDLPANMFRAGIYLVTLGLCLRALLLEREKLVPKPMREIKWGMLFVAFLMAVFATLDGNCIICHCKVIFLTNCDHAVAFGLRHNLDAFVFYQGPGGAAAEFGNISYWVNVMKSADYVAQTAIGDAILVGSREHHFFNLQRRSTPYCDVLCFRSTGYTWYTRSRGR